MAQDPVKVDPTHYKVEFENAHARVLRIEYGPRERSVMHEHPTGLGVHLTDGRALRSRTARRKSWGSRLGKSARTRLERTFPRTWAIALWS